MAICSVPLFHLAPAFVAPMTLEILHYSQPMRVRIRKYSLEQRAFLRVFDLLVEWNLVYPIPSSPRACAPLLA